MLTPSFRPHRCSLQRMPPHPEPVGFMDRRPALSRDDTVAHPVDEADPNTAPSKAGTSRLPGLLLSSWSRRSRRRHDSYEHLGASRTDGMLPNTLVLERKLDPSP